MSVALALVRNEMTSSFAAPGWAQGEIEALGSRLKLFRRRVQAKQTLFRAGQPLQSLMIVHAGFFKTCVNSADGREKITGFRMRGDLLGLEALGTETYASDTVALDAGEVWELPCAQLQDYQERMPQFRERLTTMLSGEIRRDWRWMLNLATLGADQRVAAFLIDMGERQQALGFSPNQFLLRMTRAELGNFLALQLETVTRVLSRLAAGGIIAIDRREVRILDAEHLRRMAGQGGALH